MRGCPFDPDARPGRNQPLLTSADLPACSPCRRMITHCCNRPRLPLVVQYNTRPAGKKANITPKINGIRSEEHTSELQSLMRLSYAVFCLKKQKHNITTK